MSTILLLILSVFYLIIALSDRIEYESDGYYNLNVSYLLIAFSILIYQIEHLVL